MSGLSISFFEVAALFTESSIVVLISFPFPFFLF